MDYGPLTDICEKVECGVRLSFEDGIRLYQSNDLPVLGSLAQRVRRRLNGNRVFYSVNLHINYTNICSNHCLFCAFSRRPGETGGYVLSIEEIEEKVREAIRKWDINEVHIVGGQNPTLNFDYFIRMFRAIRRLSDTIYIKALSASEIDGIALRSGMSYRDVLMAFKEEGLDGLPGGGAEIFASEIRRQICKDKIPAETWLEIHRIAHLLGIRTNATMLYGHIESNRDRVDHVLRLRELQDETRGFCSFVPLACNPHEMSPSLCVKTGGYLDLKVFAVSRLLLDNIPHLKVHWVITGLKLAQVALSFGVDDVGGTHLDEKIIHEAGSKTLVNLDRRELEAMILQAGYEPCLVDSSYQVGSVK
ncbi:MAG: CofH family radical SAM protein [Candidatus Omnitrophica bacterium]|nr:CofH family radical SAM protein [Candidatus Omnitrophota bacterium]